MIVIAGSRVPTIQRKSEIKCGDLPLPCGFLGWTVGLSSALRLVSAEIGRYLAHEVLKNAKLEKPANVAKPLPERRKWPRLPLAIPVFVRTRDQDGKEFLEFATALNVSAGGMLVAVRRVLPIVSQIQLEIPSAPVAAVAMLQGASRDFRARALRTTPAEGCYLLGLKFTRPLLRPAHSNGAGRRRKEPAPV